MGMRDWRSGELVDAVREGDRKRVLSLLEAGANPNAHYRHRRTALIVAARSPALNHRVVEALLDGGADPNAVDEMGLTALDYARRRQAKVGDGPESPLRRNRDGGPMLASEEADRLDVLTRTSEAWRKEGYEYSFYVCEQRRARREIRRIVTMLEEVTD